MKDQPDNKNAVEPPSVPDDVTARSMDTGEDSSLPVHSDDFVVRQEETGHEAQVTTPGERIRSRKTSLPEHIAGYQTLSRLGEGSFGVVLKCRDAKLDRSVAIKLQKINPLKSRSRVDRFLKEARAAGRLRHPCIIPVYEFGEFGGNQFIAYEFVDGQTLDQWLQCDPTIRERVELLSQIADALDYAHSLGIIHRDIKPANILIDHLHQHPHIADFGCAKHEHPDELQTVDGSVMGTPAYMSPEVSAGYANQADGRSDLWALGIILYEMLTGQRPFQGKYGKLFHQIQEMEPKRPRQIDESIPQDLETIALKCIEKEKQRRFETCGQLAEDLRRWLDGRPITARKVGVAERTLLWSRRNPAVAGLLATVAACLMLIALGSVLFSIYANQQKTAIERKQTEFVQSRIDALSSASATSLSSIIDDLVRLDPQSKDDVAHRLSSQKRGPRESFPFNLALFRLGKETGELDDAALLGLIDYVPVGTPEKHRTMLQIVGDDLAIHNDQLWSMALDTNRSLRGRTLAGLILASTDTENTKWDELVAPLLEHLLLEPSTELSHWCRLLNPVADRFRPEVISLFESPDASVRQQTARIISWLFEDNAEFVIQLGLDGKPDQVRQFQRVLREADASLFRKPDTGTLTPDQRSSLYLMEALAGNHSRFLPDNQQPTNALPARVRHRLINYYGPAGVPVDVLIDWLKQDRTDLQRDPVLAGAILALGQYDQQQLFQTRREMLKGRLLDLFCQHRDVAVHSATRWLLGRWGFQSDLDECLSKVRTRQPKPGYSWHEDITGVCFAVFEPVDSFHYGPSDTYPFLRFANMRQETLAIPRRFGIAIYETTTEQFAAWEDRMSNGYRTQAEKDPDNADQLTELADDFVKAQKNRATREADQVAAGAPVVEVTWDYAAFFCNGMNRLAGMDTSQDVYRLVGKRPWKCRSVEDALQKSGYRLPTGPEWEYACRGDTNSRYFFGDSVELLDYYTWSINNSYDRRQAVGLLKPNDHGLFDTLGNVSEWCQNLFEVDADVQSQRLPREVRGQSTQVDADGMTVFFRGDAQPLFSSPRRGFRLARTYASESNDPPKDDVGGQE